MKFEISESANEDIDEFIANETRRYNSKFMLDDFEFLSVYCYVIENDIISGLTGKTYWNYLEIGFLWVHQNERNSGIASELVNLAEVEAKQRGCEFSMLDTYEFQALGFYKKKGIPSLAGFPGILGSMSDII